MPITAADLFRYADDQIQKAAQKQWPHAEIRLGQHTPSVTGYVRSLSCDGKILYAKYSFLGLSLVSVLRGTCGSFDVVRAAQAAYVSSPGSLLEREAEQLRLMTVAALRAPQVAGHAGGVLFTRPLEGPTLGELIVKEPHRTEELCGRALRVLGDGLAAITARAQRFEIGERGIPATFTRKFNGVSGRTYLGLSGDHAPVLAAVVDRLRKLGLATATGPRALVYGDLKPEHVIYPDGPDCAPGFLDPGMANGRVQADVAKLISRTFLNLIAEPLPAVNPTPVADGLGALVEHRIWHLTNDERPVWLRELVLLWLMDTTNILSTYLTCPLTLPLPELAGALTQRAEAVCGLLDTVSALLAEDRSAPVWPSALAEAVQAATA
ncbi:phosphotransferase [Streptomyces spectabilis]|uniref:phosphotransferase n=1 Tax=Streptomyces spectabilis TaxID=68270 RepID=UPI0033C8973A